MTIAHGEFSFGGDLINGRGLTEAGFLASSVGATAIELVRNGPNHSYKADICAVEGQDFVPVLYFSNGLLTELHLHRPVTGQPKWSENAGQDAAAEKIANDGWLKQVLGAVSPYTFSWGLIESVLDEKGGMSFILIRFVT